MKIYLTGGTGFIGSYIAKELSDAGHDIVILARNPDKVPALADLLGVKIVHTDMNDYAALEREITGGDALIHNALCWGDTGSEMLVNETLSSLRLIECAIRRSIPRVLYTSSTAATGYSHRVTDENSRLIPEDFYGATKGAVELFISAYAKKNPSIAFNVIRPGYTFGDPVVEGGSMEGDSRFRDIVHAAKEGRAIELVKNDGTQFIWAGDLARLFRIVIESDVCGETYFGLGSRFVRWSEIAERVIEKTGSGSELVLRDIGYPDEPSLFDVSKINRVFGLHYDPLAKIDGHVQYLIDRA
jgi:UDP-glucose 4-epimerase